MRTSRPVFQLRRKRLEPIYRCFIKNSPRGWRTSARCVLRRVHCAIYCARLERDSGESHCCRRADGHEQQHFDIIMQERNVVAHLNDLDRLVDEARKRKAKAEQEASGGPVEAPVPCVHHQPFGSRDLGG